MASPKFMWPAVRQYRKQTEDVYVCAYDCDIANEILKGKCLIDCDDLMLLSKYMGKYVSLQLVHAKKIGLDEVVRALEGELVRLNASVDEALHPAAPECS